MPKVKIARKSTVVDMTAMCDVAFLLLTFFMLTSKMTTQDPITIKTPTSISEIKLPESNVLTILVDKTGKVFFGVDGQPNRIAVLKQVAESYKTKFSATEQKQFSLINAFGVPIENLHQYLGLKSADRDAYQARLGMPADSLNNQLKTWVRFTNDNFVASNTQYKIAIKADNGTPYPKIRQVIRTLQDLNLLRFNLITGLKEAPKDL
jgi:biopolymer transport protein ExbD